MPYMFLNGGGMRGGDLHHLLRGAPLVSDQARTAPRYRLHSVGGRYPALEPVATGGTTITGEMYDLPLDMLRDSLLPAEPAELELGVIELADGTPSLGMILRRPCPPLGELTDISEYGGWRAYQDQRGREARR
jgi:hypothetical protein